MAPRQLHGLDKSLHAKWVMITCNRGGRRLAFAGHKYRTARALPVHLPLLLLLPDPCSVLLRWLRSAGSRWQRRERLPGRNQTRSRRRNGSSSVAQARGPIRWCRGPSASGHRRGSRFPCTPTSRALKESMQIATGGATVGADGSRRCGSSPLGSTSRAPPKSSCSTSPFLFSLGSAFLPSLPPSSRRENSWSFGCSTPAAAPSRPRQRSRSLPRARSS